MPTWDQATEGMIHTGSTSMECLPMMATTIVSWSPIEYTQ
jgi:hypothetical protein